MIDDPEILAEPVAPEAAIEFWKQRAKLTWEEAKGLADGAKARAFYVTGLYQQDLVNLVSDALQKALEDGETLDDFKKRIADVITKQGWKDYRVETIFRTNMQSAYAAGRYRKMQAVKQSRPYWQYLAIMDKRTRPSHAILHGKVYPADHEFWQTNYPPNGFRCRCGVATLSERQVKAQNLTVEEKMPEASVWTAPKTGMEYFVNFPGADKGFRNNPYEDWANGVKPTADIAPKGVPNGWDYQKYRGQGAAEKFGPIIDAAIRANPNYARGAGYATNCQRCVIAYELLRRGLNVEALPNPYSDRTGTEKRKTMNGSECFVDAKVYGVNHLGGKAISRKEILKSLNLLPNGSRTAIFWVQPDGKGAHVIVCEKVAGELVFVDPQIGAVRTSLPRNIYQPNGHSWYRMDNLGLNPDFEWDKVIKRNKND